MEKEPTYNTDYREAGGKKVTITLSRNTIINAVLALQVVLLIVFGWQIFSIKKQLGEGGAALAKADSAQGAGTAPSAAAQPSAPSGPVDIKLTSDDHVRGNKNAKVTIVEYSDFQCPFCEKAEPTVEQVMDTYGDDVKLVYRHFPLSFHPQAEISAEAGECASDQGKFWEYHDKVFANQDSLSGGAATLKQWAKELGLNSSKFDKCLDSGEKASVVKNDQTTGSQYGVSGTPAFFINGTLVSGAQPFSVFKSAIDAALAAS